MTNTILLQTHCDVFHRPNFRVVPTPYLSVGVGETHPDKVVLWTVVDDPVSQGGAARSVEGDWRVELGKHVTSSLPA
jgi:phosphodiesterase/alkaline phosphatase D-like protein